MDINQKITEELGVKLWQVEAAVKLIDEGNTIPFIARYRKEATGTLDDEQLRKLYERLVYLRNLEEKKEQVLASIEADSGSTDSGCCRRPVSSVSAKETDSRDHRKRKRTGAFVHTDHAAEDKRVFRGSCKAIYK